MHLSQYNSRELHEQPYRVSLILRRLAESHLSQLPDSLPVRFHEGSQQWIYWSSVRSRLRAVRSLDRAHLDLRLLQRVLSLRLLDLFT